jgi:hypothetical protein
MLDNIKLVTQILQNIITSIGIIAAGLWSYYTFVRGRSFAPNVKIEFSLKQITEIDGKKLATISITLKNTGRTRINKDNCWLSIGQINIKSDETFTIIRQDESLDISLSQSKVYPIILDHHWLEPNEEVREDLLFDIGSANFVKVGIIFLNKKNEKWASNVILNTIAYD